MTNTLIFVDLASDDPAAAATFYADVFGWENDPRPHGIYHRMVPGGFFKHKDGSDSEIGNLHLGIFDAANARPHPDPAGVAPRELTTAGRKARIWILIDNPIGDNFRPENELKGRRLSGFDASNAVRMTKVSDGQLILRERIIGIARESGVRVMDPYLMLCTGTECARLDQEGVPIYKDADHLRASFIYAHAAMIDAALGMAPETAGLKKMPVRN